MDAEELQMLRSSVRSTLERTDDPDRALRELGALELLEEGETGIAVLFEEQGRAAISSSLLDRLMRGALDLPLDGAAVAFPVPRQDGRLSSATGAPAAGPVQVDGLIWAATGQADEVLLAGRDLDGRGWLATVATSRLSVTAVSGMNPQAQLVRVRGTVDGDCLAQVRGDARWPAAVAAGRRAMASELLGVADEISRIAIEHVSARRQFGRPLGSFQAVRHRLAEAHVEAAAARAVLSLAWDRGVCLDTAGEQADAEVLGAAAKAAAGKAYEVASRHALQVCGAIGLTWEYPLHRLVRHGAVLNGMLGSAADLTAELGMRMVSGMPMPVFDPLDTAGAAR
jgi:hypothetical protein